MASWELRLVAWQRAGASWEVWASDKGLDKAWLVWEEMLRRSGLELGELGWKGEETIVLEVPEGCVAFHSGEAVRCKSHWGTQDVPFSSPPPPKSLGLVHAPINYPLPLSMSPSVS